MPRADPGPGLVEDPEVDAEGEAPVQDDRQDDRKAPCSARRTRPTRNDHRRRRAGPPPGVAGLVGGRSAGTRSHVRPRRDHSTQPPQSAPVAGAAAGRVGGSADRPGRPGSTWAGAESAEPGGATVRPRLRADPRPTRPSTHQEPAMNLTGTVRPTRPPRAPASPVPGRAGGRRPGRAAGRRRLLVVELLGHDHDDGRVDDQHDHLGGTEGQGQGPPDRPRRAGLLQRSASTASRARPPPRPSGTSRRRPGSPSTASTGPPRTARPSPT